MQPAAPHNQLRQIQLHLEFTMASIQCYQYDLTQWEGDEDNSKYLLWTTKALEILNSLIEEASAFDSEVPY